MQPVELSIPDTLTFSFYGLVAWALSAVFAAFRILAGEHMKKALWMRGLMVVWLGIPAVLSIRGVFWDFSAHPPYLMRLVAPMGLLVVVFCLSPWGKETARLLPESLLVGTQGFRLPLELVLYFLAGHQVIASEMTLGGYNFDIVTGALAFPLWWKIRRLDAPRWALWAWNCLGLALLINVVTIAVLGFPEPFGWFTPPNVVVASYPWVWLPTFLVPIALSSHLLLFRKLMLPIPKPSPNV